MMHYNYQIFVQTINYKQRKNDIWNYCDFLFDSNHIKLQK